MESFMKHIFTRSSFVFVFATLLFSCKKGSDDNGNTNLPQASIGDVSKERGLTNATYRFQVSLSANATTDVSIHYATVASTAEEGTDFVPASGTLTIPAGSTQGFIDVTVTGDSLRGTNQYFGVKLDQPKGCTLKDDQGVGIIINENGLYLPTDDAGYSTPASRPSYTLVWSDEFNGTAVNTANWTHERGNNNGWGNNELQNYTDRTQNSFVSNGNLIIEARSESLGGSNYTSARMVTKQKRSFMFGRIDIRAKLPKTKGIWPALWMLGSNIDAVNWPACGEIDIMELLGQEPSKVHQTVHWGSDWTTHEYEGSSYTLTGEGFDEKFHVFSLDWEEDKIKLMVDEQEVFSPTRATLGEPYPFNKEFFFIFNIAVGGNWPGAPDGTTQFPQRMFVDYVRVFQK
jgi:beta-glucanase (GH16 family)